MIAVDNTKKGNLLELDTSSIDNMDMQPIDKPYYLRIDSIKPYVIKLFFMLHDERTETISINDFAIEYGVNSGKIYTYRSTSNENFVEPNKFIKQIPKDITDRFRNNYKYSINLLQILCNKL